MAKSQVIYEVEVSRKIRDFWFEYKFWYTVEVYENGVRNWDMRVYGYAKTEEAAKIKALKHIYKVEKLIPNTKIGVIFTTKGTASDIEESLVA